MNDIRLIFFAVLILTSNSIFAACKANVGGLDISSAATEIKTSLETIDKGFCSIQSAAKRTPLHFRVTQIERDPKKQAGFIFDCLSSASQCSHYTNQPAINELKEIYDVAKGKQGSSRDTIVAALKKHIESQVTRKCYVSKHLSSRGVDIGTRDLKSDSSDKLKKLIVAHTYKVGNKSYGIEIVDERSGNAPHFHLNFRPFGFDPFKCPKS